jgi:predicted Fe-Mo cluster-binding NifX family protein
MKYDKSLGVNTRIAIPVWEDRVSPVMDTARQLVIIELREGRESNRSLVGIPALNMFHRADFIKNLNVDWLICGAMSQQMNAILKAAGIKIMPFIGGLVDSVMAAFINGELENGDFYLPGCRRRRGRCGPGFGRGGRGRGKKGFTGR